MPKRSYVILLGVAGAILVVLLALRTRQHEGVANLAALNSQRVSRSTVLVFPENQPHPVLSEAIPRPPLRILAGPVEKWVLDTNALQNIDQRAMDLKNWY